jgi:hypothetical protein
MTGTSEGKNNGKAGIGLVVFGVYVALLALAAVSEVFGFGWFDFPVFK